MLAVPSVMLDVQDLRAGAKADIGIDEGRLVVTPVTVPSYTLDELPSQCDETSPAAEGDRGRLGVEPAGNEHLWCSSECPLDPASVTWILVSAERNSHLPPVRPFAPARAPRRDSSPSIGSAFAMLGRVTPRAVSGIRRRQSSQHPKLSPQN